MELPEDQAELVAKMAAVQAKQQQNKVEQESNQANGDRLAAELEGLAKELAESKKRKLRHGNYGVSPNGTGFVILGKFLYNRELTEVGSLVANCKWLTADCILGNIFDDLKALQEDVTEFEMEGTSRCSREKVKFSYDHEDFKIRQGNDLIYVDLGDLQSMILKFRQMQATMKRNK